MKPTLLTNYDYQSTYDFLTTKGRSFSSFQGYGETMAPLANSYFSPLNPIFGICIDDLRVLSPKKVIALRDGFLGILSFFCRFPLPPKDFSIKIGIPYVFAKIIPLPWAKYCFFYDFHLHQQRSCNKLIFINLPLEDYGIDKELHRHRLQQIFALNRIDDIQIVSVFSNNLFSSEKGHIDNLDVLDGQKYTRTGLNNFLFSSSFIETQIYFHLEPFAIYDHYLLQYAMFQGGSVAGVSVLENIDESINLSPFHCVRISHEAPEDLGRAFSECHKIWRRYEDSFFKRSADLAPYRDLYKNHFIV